MRWIEHPWRCLVPSALWVGVWAFTLGSVGLPLRGTAGTVSLTLDARGVPWLSAEAREEEVVILESARELGVGAWQEWLRGHGPLSEVADFTAGAATRVFYRSLVRGRTPADDWKNLLRGDREEPFQSEQSLDGYPEARWIKFTFLVDDPTRVYFADSARYTFHYDFALARLPQFQGWSRAAFDAATLHTNGQRAVLGAVLFPPSANLSEVGIQIVGLDAYPRECVAEWFHQVRQRLQVPPGTTVYYLPTFEQAEMARVNAEWFAAEGVPVESAGRWVVGQECYASGWAVGRLVFCPGAAIREAYRTGYLRPEDILLTDAVPAEVPPLAGIVTLTAATPNSHVALLARSSGIPFVLARASRADTVRGWTNRDVLLRAVPVPRFAGCEVTLESLSGDLPGGVRSNLLALGRPAALKLLPRIPTGQITLVADALRPADLVRIGGKAANFGILQRELPTNTPSPAVAFTFDLWDAFMAQTLADGRLLQTAIRERLADYAWPPEMDDLTAALDEVRAWITDGADFDPAARAAVVAALQSGGFDPNRQIRFRSSTNVEDSESFSGAGLYDSFSGCLADDLDDDTRGPSRCDPAEAKERGVFRALRKVYASFYNPNAYLERLRHQVDEAEVGMAVLVHHSTPDDFEEANGVATLRVDKTGTRHLTGELVTQAGAVSVVNADAMAVPEIVRVSLFSETPFFERERGSSLVPLGGTVLRWETEYRTLFSLLNRAAQGYEAEFPAKRALTLDFEYKRVSPGSRLMVKQIREVPAPLARTFTPWLLDIDEAYEPLQGETSDLIATHRLKSRWQFAVRTTPVDDAGLGTSPFRQIRRESREGSAPVVQDGPPESFPRHGYQLSTNQWIERWTCGDGPEERTYVLVTGRIRETRGTEGPVVVLRDHTLSCEVHYATPQPTPVYDLFARTVVNGTTTKESVLLTPIIPVGLDSIRQERTLHRGAVTVQTAFWWPKRPTQGGYTAPLQAWIETRIAGLTREPLVLRSPWAQTYHPGHHNFYEEFAFEPRRDPAVTADQQAELVAANIQAIILGFIHKGHSTIDGFIWGLDDRFRPL